ncbi:MAG: P1 family peptidase [Nocardioidaceae bacterium]
MGTHLSGLTIGGLASGRHNAITDVPDTRVGHTTLVEGPDIRTGVTMVLPHGGDPGNDPVFAGCHRLNGNGEVTGLEWLRESGMLTTPIGLTNTHSVGIVRDAIVSSGPPAVGRWSLPVVGETYDGFLNEINGQHVTADHVHAALGSATDGPVAEGCVGGGTGMICHGFKGGIGTASRVVSADDGGYTVGVLVQANHGRRPRLRVNGVPVGEAIGADVVPLPTEGGEGAGSIIVVIGTDAPLLPGQCDRLAQRAILGIGRTGGMGEHSSGDFVVCFATGNRGLSADKGRRRQDVYDVRMLSHERLDSLFEAVIDATEDAIVSALLHARTTVGRDGNAAHALPRDLLLQALQCS